jgi:uncharacterized protein
MNVVFLLFALLGHGFLWIGLVNRLHATGMRRRIVKRLTLVFFVAVVLIPTGVVAWYLVDPAFAAAGALAGFALKAYGVLCAMIAVVTLLRLAFLQYHHRLPSIVRFRGRRRLDINPAAAAVDASELDHHPLNRLPRNETLQLDLAQWILDVPRLPPKLDGLSIVHLSDLHFTGLIGKAFFREVVRAANDLQPDLICITGDIMDHAACFDWLPDILGNLRARHGVYFVLGNHDCKVDVGRLRSVLRECGLVGVGGRCVPIEINGSPILLAGNEQPWIRHEPIQWDRSPGCRDALRILLSHTPDHFAWAQRQNVDLMLAGHTHGGQIRIPPLGAILTPTAEGVRYIAGLFYAAPTVMYVTRGVSGDIPMRWNCRPEIAELRLRVPKVAAKQGE